VERGVGEGRTKFRHKGTIWKNGTAICAPTDEEKSICWDKECFPLNGRGVNGRITFSYEHKREEDTLLLFSGEKSGSWGSPFSRCEGENFRYNCEGGSNIHRKEK